MRFISLIAANSLVLAVLSAGINKPVGAIPPGGSTTPSLGEALANSNPEQMAVSEHLRRIGALFYGAWWCPACFKQKNVFGKQAGANLPYVECDKTENGRKRCRAAEISAYPTWVMGDKRLVGLQSLDALKRWSDFNDPSSSP